MTFTAQHSLRSQARRLGELGPGLCTTLCCITLGKSQANPFALCINTSKEKPGIYTTTIILPSLLPKWCTVLSVPNVVLGRKNFRSLTLKILLNPAQVLPSSSRFSRWADVGSVHVLFSPGRGSEDTSEDVVGIN